ncbi:MAG: hypothetical protein IJ064_05445 [Bacteroidaceae bacterium]|nr:hypothetical protein [Bacteroidaceae bacterium]
MAEIQKISYANKQYGDLWTAQEANDVKSVVNANADILAGQKTQLDTLSNDFDTISKQHAQNTQKLNTLVADNVRQVFLTQSEYDTLAAKGGIEDDVLYNIYEE